MMRNGEKEEWQKNYPVLKEIYNYNKKTREA